MPFRRTEPFERGEQVRAIAEEPLAKRGPLPLARRQDRLWIAYEGPGVRRHAVEDPLGNGVALVGDRSGLTSGVLLHQGREREARPRVIRQVVAAHEQGGGA